MKTPWGTIMWELDSLRCQASRICDKMEKLQTEWLRVQAAIRILESRIEEVKRVEVDDE